MPTRAREKGENMYTEISMQKNDRKITAAYVCMAVIIPILSLILPLSLSGSPTLTAMSWVACVVCAALLVILVKRFGSVVICAIALTFALSALNDPVPIAVILGIILVSGLYSAAVASADKLRLVFLLCAPLLSVALAYAFTRSIPLTLLSLVCFPPAIAMGLGARRSLDRSRAVALFSAVAAAELALAVLGYIVWQNKGLSIDIIEHAISYTQSVIESALRLAIDNAGAVAVDETILMEIRFMSASAINLLPGLLTVVILTAGFLSHKAECSLFDKYEQYTLLEASETDVSVSCTAAIVFLVAHVLSFTSSASYAPSFIAIAAENLSLILIPALLIVGWDRVASLPKKIGFLAIAAWIGIVLATSVLSASIISVLALIGAFSIIFARTDSWAKDHYRKGEDQ